MCRLDSVTRTYTAKTPILAFKLFSAEKSDKVRFSIVNRNCDRGKWVRWDDIPPAPSLCFTHIDGFHAFPEPKQVNTDEFDDIGIPVLLKGKITEAFQFGDPLLIGEYMYVPTRHQLEQALITRNYRFDKIDKASGTTPPKSEEFNTNKGVTNAKSKIHRVRKIRVPFLPHDRAEQYEAEAH